MDATAIVLVVGVILAGAICLYLLIRGPKI